MPLAILFSRCLRNCKRDESIAKQTGYKNLTFVHARIKKYWSFLFIFAGHIVNKIHPKRRNFYPGNACLLKRFYKDFTSNQFI